MITHNIDVNVEDRFRFDSKYTYTYVLWACSLGLIAEFIVVLIFYTDDSKVSKTQQWQAGMNRAIFCLTIVNLMILFLLVSMEDFKFAIQCFRDVRSSKTVKLACFGVFLLFWVLLGTVGVSFWLFP